MDIGSRYSSVIISSILKFRAKVQRLRKLPFGVSGINIYGGSESVKGLQTSSWDEN